MRVQPASADPHAAPERDQLPTRQQLALVTDAAALADIRDNIDRAVARIETDLEFADRDDAWAERARNALYMHRYTLRLVERRERDLRQAAKPAGHSTQKPKAQPTGHRSRENCDRLSLELLDGWTIGAGDCGTLEDVTAGLAGYDARIHALQMDRADENDRPNAAKDHAWLQRAKAALRRAGAERHALSLRDSDLRREALKASLPVRGPAREQSREQLFIDAAREALDRPTYLALWDRVDHIEATKAMMLTPNPEPCA